MNYLIGLLTLFNLIYFYIVDHNIGEKIYEISKIRSVLKDSQTCNKLLRNICIEYIPNNVNLTEQRIDCGGSPVHLIASDMCKQ